MTCTVRRATLEDLGPLSALFDAYRRFYGAAKDVEGAREFLRERIRKAESAVFVATEGDALLGFAQLYPIFSSVGMARVWVLNDLWVDASARRRGAAQSLTKAALDHARSDGAVRVELEVFPDNAAAIPLYEALGFRKYDELSRYHCALDARPTRSMR